MNPVNVMSSAAQPNQNTNKDAYSSISDFVSHIFIALRSKRDLQILILISLLAAFLRLYQLGAESLWLDEASTYVLSSKTLSNILEATAGDVHPPLYYILVHFFLIAGNSETILRLPSMLMGIMGVPLIYLLASRLFTPKEGLVAAFLLSVSIMHIYYSQEARMYSMLLFLSLCSVYFFYLAVEDNKKINWIFFSFFTVLNIYTHYFGFFIFPIEIFFYLVTQISLSKKTGNKLMLRLKDVQKSKMFAVSVLLIIFLIIPRIQVFAEQAMSRVGGEVTWGIGPSHLIPILLGNFSNFSSSPSILFMLLFTIGIFAVIIHNRKQGLLLCMWFIFPIIVSFYLAGIMPFQPRYLLFILPAFLILVARGITFIPSIVISTQRNNKKKSKNAVDNSKSKQVILIVAIVIVLFLNSVGSLSSYYSTPQKNDWREVSSFIEANTQSGDVIVALPSYMSQPLTYYYDNLSDGTYITNVGYTENEFNGIVKSTAPNRVFFVLTGDINAANPDGTTLEWLQNNANVVTVINGVYILTPKI